MSTFDTNVVLNRLNFHWISCIVYISSKSVRVCIYWDLFWSWNLIYSNIYFLRKWMINDRINTLNLLNIRLFFNVFICSSNNQENANEMKMKNALNLLTRSIRMWLINRSDFFVFESRRWISIRFSMYSTHRKIKQKRIKCAMKQETLSLDSSVRMWLINWSEFIVFKSRRWIWKSIRLISRSTNFEFNFSNLLWTCLKHNTIIKEC